MNTDPVEPFQSKCMLPPELRQKRAEMHMLITASET